MLRTVIFSRPSSSACRPSRRAFALACARCSLMYLANESTTRVQTANTCKLHASMSSKLTVSPWRPRHYILSIYFVASTGLQAHSTHW